MKNVLGLTLPQTLDRYDVMLTKDDAVKKCSAPDRRASVPPKVFSQDCRWDTLDDDRAEGCIRSLEHAYSKDGGLAVLYGNFAENGCIVKTAGVDDSILKFTGPAKVYESQTMRLKQSSAVKWWLATWLSFATKGRKAGQACRKCSTQPPS